MGTMTAAEWAARPRSLQRITLTEVKVTDDWVSCRAGCLGFSLRLDECEALPIVGREYDLETVNISITTGLRSRLGWLTRRTDQQLADDHNAMIAKFEQERRDALAQNRATWTAQEAALPEWLRDRLARFRTNGGEQFDLDGWAYELFICRLAAVLESGGEEAAERFAEDEGATGNQWSCAKGLVAAHNAEQDLTQFPAGATPITGDPFYRGKGVTTP